MAVLAVATPGLVADVHGWSASIHVMGFDAAGEPLVWSERLCALQTLRVLVNPVVDIELRWVRHGDG